MNKLDNLSIVVIFRNEMKKNRIENRFIDNTKTCSRYKLILAIATISSLELTFELKFILEYYHIF